MERQLRSRSIPAAEAEEILSASRDDDTELNSSVNITGCENVLDSSQKSSTTNPNDGENNKTSSNVDEAFVSGSQLQTMLATFMAAMQPENSKLTASLKTELTYIQEICTK
jgi:hypothetical protein